MSTQVDIVDVLRAGLEKDIQERMFNKLMTEQMEQFRQQIEPQVRELVEEITISSIKRVADAVKFLERIDIAIRWEPHL